MIGASAPLDQQTPESKAAIAVSDSLVEEFLSADRYVFGVPMYNFSVPSTLRAYFDRIARAGVTFRYTANGPEGLLKGTRAYVFITRGGIYAGANDTQTPYLRQFLGFLGIDTEFVYAEGLGMGAEARTQSVLAAEERIAQLAELPLAA